MMRNKRARGINVIATMLMLITFFLVVGFGIGALSTMNLNISGKYANVQRANELAEAAVAQFMYQVSDMTAAGDQKVSMDNLASPPLNLDRIYDGNRRILDRIPPELGDNCSVDVHFGPGNTRPYYSTDNSSSQLPAVGYMTQFNSFNKVPPFTFDLIITVKLGLFEKHYQVWISRLWDYALYIENGPVHLLGGGSGPCTVDGDIFSRFVALPGGTYPPRIAVGRSSDGSYTDYVDNYIPGKNYPSSIFLGAAGIYRESYTTPTPSVTVSASPTPLLSDPRCVNNTWTGRGVYSFSRPPLPDPSPSRDMIIYDHNTKSNEGNSFDSTSVSRPYEHLVLAGSSGKSLAVFTSSILEVDNYDNTYVIENCRNKGLFDLSEEVDGTFMVDEWNELCGKWRDEEKAKMNRVYYLQSSLNTNETSAGDFKWPVTRRYYLDKPLQDKYYTCVVGPGIPYNKKDKDGSEKKYYPVTRKVSEHKADTNCTLTLDNTMLVSNISGKANIYEISTPPSPPPGAIHLSKSSIEGDNTMLQIDGPIEIVNGHINAGEHVGAVMCCTSFFIGSGGGRFNGILMCRDSLMAVNPETGSPEALTVNGGIVLGGIAGDPMGGLSTMGMQLTYDPRYMKFMNRFGRFRVDCWRTLD